MSSSPRLQALTRQWDTLLRIPQGEPGITCAELTRFLNSHGHDVGRRTVERDLNELSATFGLTVVNPDSKPFRWMWSRDRLPELGTLNVSDALSLCIAAEILRSLLPQTMLKALNSKIEQAQRTLAAMEPSHPVSRWRNKVRFVPAAQQLLTPTISESALVTLQDALIHERQLQVNYSAFNANKTKKLTLNPLALIVRGPVPYLIATANPYDDPLSFAIHRMRSPLMLETPLRLPPDGFDIDAFIASGRADFGTTKPIKFKASITNELAQYLAETPLAKDQKICPTRTPDQWTLTATVPDTWQLEMWILSQAEHVRVLAPKPLKTLIHNRFKMALERY
jgi:predicted DNA-binding transcriptional regulator YafY